MFAPGRIEASQQAGAMVLSPFIRSRLFAPGRIEGKEGKEGKGLIT